MTIEFVLWLPLALFLVMLAVDTTFAFLGMTNMWQVSRETARVLSRYGEDPTAAQTTAENEGTFLGVKPSVSIVYNGGDVTVAMSMPAYALSPFGSLGFGTNKNITTVVTHVMEPL